jgi:hypothetical protein
MALLSQERHSRHRTVRSKLCEAGSGLGFVDRCRRFNAARAKVRIMALFLSMACFGPRQIGNYMSIVPTIGVQKAAFRLATQN